MDDLPANGWWMGGFLGKMQGCEPELWALGAHVQRLYG